jgi:hypothetical protein
VEKIAGEGNYYAPTVLGNVTPDMTAFRQELFGPVAAITVAKDAEHALRWLMTATLAFLPRSLPRYNACGEILPRAGVRRGVYQWL